MSIDLPHHLSHHRIYSGRGIIREQNHSLRMFCRCEFGSDIVYLQLQCHTLETLDAFLPLAPFDLHLLFWRVTQAPSSWTPGEEEYDLYSIPTSRITLLLAFFFFYIVIDSKGKVGSQAVAERSCGHSSPVLSLQ